MKPPKKKRGIGKKILALVLCCVLSSAVSVGALTALVGTGVISLGSNDSNPAFTINKVTAEESTVPTDGKVTALTRQEIAAKLIPSVVCIQNYQVNQRFGFFGASTGNADNTEISPTGEGSGIVLSEDGYIVTNAHVVDSATSLKVVLSDGTSYEATLVGIDTITDLAVIKIEAAGLSPAEFGSSEDMAVADEVIAIGNPGGLSLNSSVTVGYVSALNREISNGSTGYTMTCIQTDAAINPGNSGGALVNEYGQVIGINSAKFVDVNFEGLGFAIPSEISQPIVSDLMQYGYVKDRAILGISGEYVDAMSAGFYGLTPGYFVAEVTKQTAKDAGLMAYDVITSIDGVKVTSSGTLTSVLTTKKPGDTVELVVDRAMENKSDLTLKVTLSEFEKVITTPTN